VIWENQIYKTRGIYALRSGRWTDEINVSLGLLVLRVDHDVSLSTQNSL